jgi:site-specific DNA-methyltransferase (adenine-specific)
MLGHFGETLARLRAERGWTRRQLGNHSQASTADIREAEQLASRPDDGFLRRLAAAFAMEPDGLLLAAGILPAWLRERARNDPAEVLAALGPPPDGSVAPNVSSSAPLPAAALRTELGSLHDVDCLDLLRAQPDDSVDLVFADPPFNLSKDYGADHDDNVAETAYLDWSRAWLREAVRVLRPGGSLFVYNLPRWNLVLGAWLAERLTFRNWISVDFKSSLPIAGRLYPSHYGLLYFTKGRRPSTFEPPRLPLSTCRHCGGELRDYGGYKDRMNPRGVNLTDVWTDISPVRHARYKRRKGANELPLKLLDRVLDLASRPGDLVLDPFGGSGTTYVAAELKGRRWIGAEIGDCSPILARFEALDVEREHLATLRLNVNTLFTDDALALRERHGHDTSRFRLS